MFPRKNRGPIFAIYLASFFSTLTIALPLYINSSFLDQFIPEQSIGLVYSAGSFITLFALAFYPRLLSRWGNYRIVLATLVSELLFLLGLSFLPLSPATIAIFLLAQVSSTLVFFTIDVFLESFTREALVGTIRGAMLTILNIAVLLGPLITGIILREGGYEKVYLYSAFLIIPVIAIFLLKFRRYRDPLYDYTPIFLKMKRVFFTPHPNDRIRHVFGASFLIGFFYSWMVIYTPIYLHHYIGFSWSEIGVILPIVLLAFILIEFPVGKLLDRYNHEPLVITGGFIVTALFTASLFFLTTPSLALWSALLFGTRVGISLVEIASESYFFRHIKSSEANVMSIFREAAPVAWLVGPLTASLILSVATIQYLFPVLALFMLYGAWVGIRLKG